MKFGKEFKNQKVPEWIEAYVDYNGLKRILQRFRLLEQTKIPQTPLRSLQQKSTVNRQFSGLNIQHHDLQSRVDIEAQVIATNAVMLGNSRKRYSTKFLLSSEDVIENDILFFHKLDEELNKVNNFYKDKVEEAMKEANLLNRQMDALVALRVKVMNRDSDAPSSLISLSTDIDSSAPSKVTTPSKAGTEAIAEILARVKISNTLENPMSTIRGVLKDSREKDLRFKKQELREVEERLKVAFIEFYQKLHLLKHFSFMNLSAFSKILKKYEKVTSRKATRSYMNMVDESYLGSSEEVIGLLNRVEEIFVKHFSNSNRREGMKLLRPKRKREQHSITFFSGFFSGCSIALLTAIILVIQTKKIDSEETNFNVGTIFPLYSFYAYIVLHMLLYAANIFLWGHFRINYTFIFGFKQGTELGYQEVFLLSNGLAMLALATFLAHLHLKMDPRSQDNLSVEFFPLGLIIILLGMVFCPFNILYRSSRFFLVRCMFRCICAPLYKVTLSDFFLADQLTSQVQAIRSLEYYMCYYIAGDYAQEKDMCHSIDVYNVFYFIVAVIPYWLRFLQCIRRFFEEKDTSQGFNGLRYLSTIIAVVIRTAFELKKTVTWEAFAVVSSVIATLANTYWDIVRDWGLLQRNSKNLFLRDKLVVSNKSVYFLAMVLDVLLRFAWLQLVLTFNIHSLSGIALSTLFSCLEIIRRGMWNFFRLENEHLNNVGKYRAFKSVPLPFLYHDDTDDESDDKDD
ncbi:secondary carrier transporter [Lithospermum erythrorhizon]|uniref:Secondary carrier transporter n=1 Tax=Lithospermum erythrorhizon TaxID=34254 RepID=A0AAV3PMK3_LITER